MANSVQIKLKDHRTCRIFFSSPFGGMEGERDELSRKYFPQLNHLCNSRGIQFVPVDMRWGITEEAAAKAQTINICLREVDRCDLFVGFYGQRYGWHGTSDKVFQQNIDNALRRYSWLKSHRDCSVTELEYLHGFLNKPGAIPACFCFRDKGYDDSQVEEGDEKQALKYLSEGPEAKKKLDSLKKRVEAVKGKTLAVHTDYFTPEEGANHAFNAIWDYLSKVLLSDISEEEADKISQWKTEAADHDKFMVSRLGLYVGGEKFLKQLDKLSQTSVTEKVLVTGASGQGKSALLANWVAHMKKTQPKVLVVGHFVGSSQHSDRPSRILKRVTVEVERFLDNMGTNGHVRFKKKSETGNHGNKDIQLLMSQLTEALKRAEKVKQRVVIVIDGLDKLEKGSKTAKPLFWLPDVFGKNVKLVTSAVESEATIVEELVKTRRYTQVKLSDMDASQRKQICEKALGDWGKTLSKPQLKKVVDKQQGCNPRYMSILVTELALFGSFRQLDEKIDSLVKSDNVGELCEQMLVRLESDYNSPDHPDMVQQVLRLLCICQEGLSESEITAILNIPVCLWLPLFFALEPFILHSSGLLRFAFSELREAVNKRYLCGSGDSVSTTKVLIKYFDDKRKHLPLWPVPAYSLRRRPAYELPWLQRQIKEKSGLVNTLLDLNVFHTLVTDDEYSLLELWQTTGMSMSEVADRYLKNYDDAVIVVTKQKEKSDMVPPSDVTKPPAVRMLFHLENLRYFMDLAGHKEGIAKACQKIINILEKMKGQTSEGDRQRLLCDHQYYLACCRGDSGQYQEAESLHTQVIQYWRQNLGETGVHGTVAETRLAWALNGLGLVQYHQQKYKEAEKLFQESESIHQKNGNLRHEADSLVNLGLVCLATKDLQKAVDTFLAAIKLYEAVHFDSVPHTIGNVYTNLGLAYRRMDNLDLAEKYYFKSVEIKSNSVGEDHPTVAVAYMNLGTLEMLRKGWTDTELYLFKAYNIYKSNGYGTDRGEYRQCLENLVNCYIQQGKNDQATEHYWTVFDGLVQHKAMDQCLPNVHNAMARYYLEAEEYDRANRILTELIHSPKQTPATFLYLDQLDQRRPTGSKSSRPATERIDHGLKLFPGNPHLLKQKVMAHFILRDDVDGAMTFWQSVSAGPGDFATLVDWCKEAKLDAVAADVLKRALKLFPELG